MFDVFNQVFFVKKKRSSTYLSFWSAHAKEKVNYEGLQHWSGNSTAIHQCPIYISIIYIYHF